jgi:hypothetical protein
MRIRDLQAVEFARLPAGSGSPREIERPALHVSVRARRDTLLAELTIGAPMAPPPGTPSGEFEPLHLARANGGGQLASITATDLSALALGPSDLRDRRLMDLAEAEIDSLAILSDGRWARGAAADSVWASIRAGLPEWRVTGFVDEKAGGTALAGYGLAPPRIVVRVKTRNGAAREVYLGDEEPVAEGVYAHRPGVPGVAVVPRTVRDSILEGWSKVANAAGTAAGTAPGGAGSRR